MSVKAKAIRTLYRAKRITIEGVKQAVNELGLLGALSGGLTATSAGIAASVFFGLLMAILFKSKDKN